MQAKACYNLSQDDVANASALMKEMKPKSIPELILFAIINVLLHQQHGNVSRIVQLQSLPTLWSVSTWIQKYVLFFVMQKENLAIAQNYYNRIGSRYGDHNGASAKFKCLRILKFLVSCCVLIANLSMIASLDDCAWRLHISSTRISIIAFST